jgi:hypothetical protein
MLASLLPPPNSSNLGEVKIEFWTCSKKNLNLEGILLPSSSKN